MYNYIKRYAFMLDVGIKTCVILTLWSMSLTTFAQQRTMQSVIDIAGRALVPNILLSSDGSVNSEEIIRSSEILQNKDLITYNVESFYVIRPKSGSGFVIVSADLRMRTILGFSYTESFDVKNIPGQVKEWLQQYTDEMLSMELASSENPIGTMDGSNIDKEPFCASLPILSEGVDPLLGGIQWNQSAPYNNKCPIDIDGERCVTGCVATAMAQVMKYHRFPVKGTGSVNYTTSTNKLPVSVTFGETYDWSNMLDSYKDSYTTTQANAVATLMFHCGASINMDYTSESSGTQQDKIRTALYNYFGYDSDMAHVSKSDYTEEDWNTLLVNELNAGRPVNYSGSQGLSGHSFVFDGYTMREGVSVPYYHVNWGWAGLCDGYYLTSSLAPSSTGIGGGYGNYTDRQQMVIGIKPEDNAFSTPVMDGTFTSSQNIFHYGDNNSITISMRAYNRTCRSFAGTIKLVAIGSDGSETTLYTHTQSSSVATSSSCSVNTTVSLPSSMGVGSYKLEWRCNYSGKSNYSHVGFPEDFHIIIYDESPQLVATVSGDATLITPSEQYSITINVKNTGNMTYEGKIIAKIHQSTYDVTLESEACAIEAGATENVVISGWLRTMFAGNATVTFYNSIDDQRITNVNGSALSINAIAEVATADVSVSSMKSFDYSSDHKTITIYSYNFRNNSSVNYVGSCQLVLMDTQNNILRKVGNVVTNDGDGLGKDRYYLYARRFSFEFPSDIPNGNYRLGTIASQTNSGIWTLAKQWYSSAIQYIDVEVQTSNVIIGELTFVRTPYNGGVLVTNIALNKSAESLNIGSTVALSATITPSNASNKNVTWSSSNTSVATVSTSGVVTAVGVGSATITCTAADGSGKSATCSITVTPATIEGDANGDGDVDVSDVALAVEYILGHNPSGFTFAAADLDKDGVIDVADVAMMVNIIMYGNPSGLAHSSKVKKVSERTPYVYLNAHDDMLNLWLSNTSLALSSIQFDLALPQGVDVKEVMPSSFMDQHIVSSSLLENGVTRVICISLNNSLLSPDENGILSFMLTDRIDSLEYLELKNIYAATPNGSKTHLHDVSLRDATIINHVASEQAAKDIYSLSGQKRKSIQKGVNIVKQPNGSYKKVILKK